MEVKNCYRTFFCLLQLKNTMYLLDSTLSSAIFFVVNAIAEYDLRGDCLGDFCLMVRGIFSFGTGSDGER